MLRLTYLLLDKKDQWQRGINFTTPLLHKHN